MVDHLLEEVDADLRADKMEQLWSRYRTKLFAAVVALLVGTAGFTLWNNYQEKRGGEQMLALVEAQTLYAQDKFAEAATAFEKAAATLHGNARTLALLWQGRALAADKQTAPAIAVFKNAADATPSLWSDLACLRLASLDSAQAECLSRTTSSPLEGQRHAWQAATDWNAGKKESATKMLEELATSDSETEASRAQLTQWLATIRAQATPTE